MRHPLALTLRGSHGFSADPPTALGGGHLPPSVSRGRSPHPPAYAAGWVPGASRQGAAQGQGSLRRRYPTPLPVAVRDQGLGWMTALITTLLLLVVALPRPASASHCSLSASAGNSPVTTLSQLASRPNSEIQCNSFNMRSGLEGAPRSAPGFNPFRLLAFEQQLTSHIMVTGDSPLCRPLNVSQGGNLVSLANCVDRFILSSLQPGQITGNPFGLLVSFPGMGGQRGGIQAGAGGPELFSLGNQPLQSQIVPDGDNTTESPFSVNPLLTAGTLLSVTNDSGLPGRLGSLRTRQATPAGLKSFGLAFGNEFVFNPVTGSSLQRPGQSRAMAPGSGSLELGSAFCPPPVSGRATVCARLTVMEEIEGAVGDEAVTQGIGDTSEIFLLLTSFHTSVNQTNPLTTFDNPVVFWRQRVDEGLFILDTLGSFMYNDGGQNPLQFPNSTYVTGGSITNAAAGFSDLQTATILLPGGLSSFANLVSVVNGVCLPGGFGGETVTNCPQTP